MTDDARAKPVVDPLPGDVTHQTPTDASSTQRDVNENVDSARTSQPAADNAAHLLDQGNGRPMSSLSVCSCTAVPGDDGHEKTEDDEEEDEGVNDGDDDDEEEDEGVNNDDDDDEEEVEGVNDDDDDDEEEVEGVNDDDDDDDDDEYPPAALQTRRPKAPIVEYGSDDAEGSPDGGGEVMASQFSTLAVSGSQDVGLGRRREHASEASG